MQRKLVHKLLSMALSLILVLTLFPATAQAYINEQFVDSGLTFMVQSEDSTTQTGTVRVGNNSSCSGSCIIPETVIHNGITYTVTEIGDQAFLQAGLTEITIPASVTSIGEFALNGCTSLTNVTFESGSQLTNIGYGAFLNSGLNSIDIPVSVTSIGQWTFYNCKSLTAINFEAGSKITGIGEHVFDGSGLNSITIPAGVTGIGDSAFNGCSNLAAVTFESGSQLTSIGDSAFSGSGLNSITIPAGVTSIGDFVFSACSNLAAVTFESGSQLTRIGNSAFSGSGLNSIAIPAGVTGIGDFVFYGCSKLAAVTFESGSQLTSIGEYAFSRSGLNSIAIPAGVTSIGDSVFIDCSSLTAVTFLESTPPSIGTSAFANTASSLAFTVLPGTIEAYRAVLPTGADVTDGTGSISAVTITPASATVVKGNTQSFSAIVSGTGSFSHAVTWSVTGGGSGTSIDPNGVLTVAADEVASQLTVTTTSVGDPTKKDYAMVYVYTAPAAQLSTPTGLVWDGTTAGKATWSAVSNASSYSVQLEKNGSNQGTAVSVASGTEYYDFTSAIIAAGSGTYTFTVTAIGDGTIYSDSTTSSTSVDYLYTAPATQLSTPTGLAWDGTIPGKVTWSAVSNASSYSVQLKKNGVNQGTAVSVASGTEYYDFKSAIIAAGSGTYTFTVTAIGDGTIYSDSTTSSTSVGYLYTAPVIHSGGGGSYTPPSTSTTVTGSVKDDKTGQTVKGISVEVTTATDGTKIVAVKSQDTILLKQPDGTSCTLSDISKLSFSTPITNDTGSTTNTTNTPSVILKSDGTIQVSNLAKGTETKFNVTYDLGNGQRIVIGTMDVSISSSGIVSLTDTLIDPYGIITDAATGKVIDGVNVTLYYANTDRNKANGKTPDTVVQLPAINGFKPNNNANPQVSDSNGAYGFMVFPTTDYYIVATKDGYNKYTSPTISVEQEIVKWDFKMNQTTSGVTRLSGLTRVDTVLAIAKANYPGKVANVILVTADNYPDALAGSVLAYKLNAPILLVGGSDADQEKVLDYMKSSMDSNGTVYILGGTGAVSKVMEAKVTASGFNNIIRIDGADRYETSTRITDIMKVAKGTPIVLVSGENYPDALSISSVAAVNQYPILMVKGNEIPDAVKKEIAKINPPKVYIIGLNGAISDEVEKEVQKLTSLDKANIVRIGGENRFETSLNIAEYFALKGNAACIATGNNFPDALAGSIYAAKKNAPIILIDKELNDSDITFLMNKKLEGITIFGGESAVSKEAYEQLSKLLGR